MEGSKYQVGDKVRCLNEQQPCWVKRISRDEYSFFYDIEYHGNTIVQRVPESGLVSF